MHKILDHLNNRDFTINTTDGVKLAACHLLQDQPERLHHTLGVAERIDQLLKANNITDERRDMALQSAYLHDVGYSQEFAFSGFHPYDGYVYLKENGWHPDVAASVLHHSFAGSLMRLVHSELDAEYRRVKPSRQALQITELVTLADLHTAPDGSWCTFDDRLENIAARHGADSVLVSHLRSHRQDVYSLVARWGLWMSW